MGDVPRLNRTEMRELCVTEDCVVRWVNVPTGGLAITPFSHHRGVLGPTFDGGRSKGAPPSFCIHAHNDMLISALFFRCAPFEVFSRAPERERGGREREREGRERERKKAVSYTHLTLPTRRTV